MFIDIHCHAYRHTPPGVCRFCTPDQLLRRYDAEGIERGAILPIVSPEIYLPQANEEILEMVADHPDRLIPFCNIDPRALTNSPDAPLDDLLRHYKNLGCKGLGEVMPNMPLLDPMVQNLLAHAEEVGLPVTMDGSDRIGDDFGIYDEPGLPHLEQTLERFPDLVVFGHGPLFWWEIAPWPMPPDHDPTRRVRLGEMKRPKPTGPVTEEGAMPRLMRKFPNLYGDLSDGSPREALARDPEYGAKFIEEFQDRLMFGTDLVSPTMPIFVKPLLLEWREEGRITETVFQKIARENAIRILGLD